MQIAIITIFPAMFQALTDYGVISRAVKNHLLTLHFFNPRDYTTDPYQRVDDRPYGGGPGMVMLAEPLYQAINDAKAKLGEDAPVYYLSAQGETFTQQRAIHFSKMDKLILLCGRYEGIDERIITKYVDGEISIGDYVLTGGELPAMVLVDSVIRLLPGVLGDETSKDNESFMINRLDCPHYTRPEIWQEMAVPEVLLSGNHAAIEKWRAEQAEAKTKKVRPDLLK